MMERLQHQYIHSANRRAYVPGDMPNEIWRILFNDQWLIKGYTPKWGIGYSAEEESGEQSQSNTKKKEKKKMFPEPKLFKEHLKHLLDVIC